MTLQIKFSHKYQKLNGTQNTAKLLQVVKTNKKLLSKDYVEYDTKYDFGHYMLPQGKLLLLIFKSGDVVFTTMRSWTQEKENYYLAGTGQEFEIKIGD